MVNKGYTAEDFGRITPEISRYLNKRLDEWADWFIRDYARSLGFPKQNTIHKMMVLGNVPKEDFTIKPLPTNEPAEEIEKLIRIMAFQNNQTFKYANALREYYIYSQRSKRRTARALGVSEAITHAYVENAHLWLSGWFTASYGSRFLKWAGRQ